MASLDRISQARLRLLVAVARADGQLLDSEITAIRNATGNHDDLAALLSEEIDTAVEIAALGSDEERKRVYEAGYAIAYADGHAAVSEVALLREIWDDKGEANLLQQVLGETRDTLLPSNLLPIADPTAREEEIQQDTLKYAALAAVAAAVPTPPVVGVINDAVVVGIQLKLIRDIGQYWGHKVDAAAARALLAGVAGAIGVQIAVNNLMRFVPGVGSVVAGTAAFASTFAIAKVADAYYGAGTERPSPDAMKTMFAAAKQEGREAHKLHADKVAALQAQHGEAIAELHAARAAGKIDKATYDARLAELIS